MFETDADGRFRANPISTERYDVGALAPAGKPYLNSTSGMFTWVKGTVERRVDLMLQPGTLLSGRVTEQGSGRPVAGTALRYVARPSAGFEAGPWSGQAHTSSDGCYQLAALPKDGTLVVLGPSEDFVLDVMAQTPFSTASAAATGGMPMPSSPSGSSTTQRKTRSVTGKSARSFGAKWVRNLIWVTI